MRNHAYRRRQDRIHAKRKRRISHEIYGMDWYKNEHQYSKNKIHCSCPLCRFYGPSYSDMKKEAKDKYSVKEWEHIQTRDDDGEIPSPFGVFTYYHFEPDPETGEIVPIKEEFAVKEVFFHEYW